MKSWSYVICKICNMQTENICSLQQGYLVKVYFWCKFTYMCTVLEYASPYITEYARIYAAFLYTCSKMDLPFVFFTIYVMWYRFSTFCNFKMLIWNQHSCHFRNCIWLQSILMINYIINFLVFLFLVHY